MIPIGTILKHSIGYGCDSFHQVVRATEQSITIRQLEIKVVNHNLRCQTCDYLPLKDRFKIGAGKQVLRITPERIGPRKRLIWWSVWEGQPANQWCP